MIGKLCKKKSFLESAVSTTNNGHVLCAFIEGSVARGTKMDTSTNEVGLTFGVGSTVGRPRGDQHRSSSERIPSREVHAQEGFIARDCSHRNSLKDLDTITLGLTDDAVS